MGKIKEIINKILGKPSGSSDSTKGFTLVELLIVIAVIGILAAALLVAIDPIDRINSANDANLQQDLSAVANAVEAYAVTNDGAYPADMDALINNGDLRADPGTVNLGNGTGVVTVEMSSKKYDSAPLFIYDPSNGKKCFGATTDTSCP